MKKILVITMLVAFFTYACNYENVTSNNNRDSINDLTDSVSENTSPAKNNKASKACDSIVKDFLGWYKANHKKTIDLQNLVVSLQEDSNAAQYRVNFTNAEKYLEQLRSSGYFSEKFLQDKLQYFKAADENLVKLKQNDGPPDGFEYDLLLFTQEPESLLAQYKSIQTEQVDPHLVKIKVSENNLLFKIGEHQGKCVIDSINPEE